MRIRTYRSIDLPHAKPLPFPASLPPHPTSMMCPATPQGVSKRNKIDKGTNTYQKEKTILALIQPVGKGEVRSQLLGEERRY